MWLLHTLGWISNCKGTTTDEIVYQWQSCDFIAILAMLFYLLRDTAELDHTGPSKEGKCH